MARLEAGMRLENFVYDTAWEQGKDFYGQNLGCGKKLVLRFLRYYGCGVCQLDTWELAEAYDRFARQGARLFVVMQSAPETIREQVEEGALPFDLICDPDQSLYRKLEIGDVEPFDKPGAYLLERIEKANARGITHGKYEGNEQQAPAMFILDDSMQVLYAHYGKDPVDLPTIEQTLALLNG